MATIAEALAVALQYHQAGNLAQAEQLYRQILQANPAEGNALHLLGMLAHQVGQPDKALALIGQAVAVLPQVAEFHSNLAGVYLALGRWDEAIGCYGQALRLRPDLPELHYNLGDALAQQHKWVEAVACYRQGLALRPTDAEAYRKLGFALVEQGRLVEAVASYREALRLGPDNADTFNNLGVALAEQGRFAEAEAVYRQALRLRPDFLGAHYNLGLALAEQWSYDEALVSFEQALRLKPDCVEALSGLATAYKNQGRLDEAIATYRKAIAAKPEDPIILSNLLLALHYDSSYDPATTFAEHLRWAGQFGLCPTLDKPPRPVKRDPGRRLRVGYVSPSFYENGLGRYGEAVIDAHDHGQIEVFCYANVLYPDALTQRIKASADHWRSLVGLSDDRAADLIRQDQIDLLIDLSGHTSGNRLGVFARKPAPIQVTHFGYCDTTGLAAIDYRLTDSFCDPPGQTERYHTEKLVRLPEVQWCYRPTPGPEVSSLPARQAGQVTFGSFNSLCKVTEPMIGLWSDILRGLPGSRMVVVSGGGTAGDERVLAAFDARGVGKERVTLVGRQPVDAYFRLHHGVDICLDTYPFTGCFTTADALWMGVPVISLAGPTFVTRQGVAILAQVALGDLATETPAGYVEVALRLGRDLPRLEELRSQLRDRLERSPLADVRRFTQHLEAAYRAMWELFCH